MAGHTGQRIDGALAIDPTAISYLLKVTGPARLPDGSSVTGDEVVSLTQQTLYRTHPDKAARKAYLLAIARGISTRLLSAHGSAELARAAVRGAGEHRILAWSADPAVQQRLAASPVAGLLRAGDGYLAGFSTVNATGGKLDYYLTRSMTYSRQGCGAGSTSTSTFTLTNDVPAGPLPGYVTLRLDAPGYRTRPGDNKVLLSYYGTPGSQVTGVTLDGRRVVAMPSSEHGLHGADPAGGTGPRCAAHGDGDRRRAGPRRADRDPAAAGGEPGVGDGPAARLRRRGQLQPAGSR